MNATDSPTVTISSVGDVRPQRSRIARKLGDRSALQRLAADVVLGNLEVVLTSPLPAAAKLVVARADPDSIGVLREMDLTAISVANNHALDFGVQGFANMCNLLREAGILYFGGGENLAAAWEPLVLERNGLRIAVIGISGTVPPGSAARVDQPGLAGFKVETAYRMEPALLQEEPGSLPWVQTWVPDSEVDLLRNVVARARAVADVVIVQVHWGVSYQDHTADYQRQVAAILAEAGAGLIVGHHPHQLQGVGICGGVPVLYSLGDFLTHFRRPRNVRFPSLASMDPAKARRSLIARATFSHAGIQRLELVPVILDEVGEPRLAEIGEAEALFSWLGELSEPLGGLLSRGEDGAMELILPGTPKDRPS